MGKICLRLAYALSCQIIVTAQGFKTGNGGMKKTISDDQEHHNSNIVFFAQFPS